MFKLLSAGLLVMLAVGCDDKPKDLTLESMDAKPEIVKGNAVAASALGGQRGKGMPYEVVGSEVWDVPDQRSGRNYQVFVATPPSYSEDPDRHYPVLYVTDADYAFPIIRQIARRLNIDGQEIDEFILVGLSYAVGENGADSRRRDYTLTKSGSGSVPGDAVYGGARAYQIYLRDQVIPFVEKEYRAEKDRRLFLGHSYGSLLGTQILLTEPEMFSGYVLGSPSYWYDPNSLAEAESTYAANHRDLVAEVYIYIGEYEETKRGDPRYARKRNMVSDAKRMERVLRSRNYPSLRLKLEVLSDEDHLSVAPRGFTHGLTYLLSTSQH